MPIDKQTINSNPYPTIVAYNRLETSPYSSDYQRSLLGEVRDPLWMLARQWQVGEFEAEDGGSVFQVRVLSNRQRMDTLSKSGTPLGGACPLPLEYLVEREHRTPDLTLRVEAGKLFRALVEESLTLSGMWWPHCLERYSLNKLENEAHDLHDQIQADPVASILYESLKTASLDGLALYQDIAGSSQPGFKDWVQNLPPLDEDQREEALYLGQSFQYAFEQFYGPVGNQRPDTWSPERMEYCFSLNAGQSSNELEARQYYQSNPDWHTFDLTMPFSASGATREISTFFPGRVNHIAAARGRWWEMEEKSLNLGKVPVKSTDLLTMVMLDFALVYGNDWLLLPFPLEVNSLCKVEGLLVTDVFGVHTVIRAADAQNPPSYWQKWSLFNQGEKNLRGQRGSVLYLVPSLLKRQEAEPLEQVAFRRDEMANLVWAFEQKIPDALGHGQHIYETEPNEEHALPEGGLPRYVLGTDIPSFQIPFIPVQDKTNTQTRLQRARMYKGTHARGALLTEISDPFYIYEEEIPKEGITVSRRWQRIRWINGQTFVWVGREKELGKGDVRSRLAFDQII